MTRHTHKEPMLNLEEPAPIIFGGMLILVHALTVIAPSIGAFLKNAFVLAAQNGNALVEREIGSLPTLLTHVLAHASWQHVIMNAAFIAIFGVLVMRGVKNKSYPVLGRFDRGVLVFFGFVIFGAIAGGLAQWLFWAVTKPEGWAVALGASTAETALFAAMGWVLGGKQRMIIFLALVIGMDLLSTMTGGNPAWAGHMGGMLAGMVLAPLWLKPESVGINLLR